MNKGEGMEIMTIEPPNPCRITIMQCGGRGADFRLICEDQSFFAHKLIVAASSMYMRDIFTVQEFSGTDGVFTVMMNGLKPVDVSNVLKYIYVGELRVRSSESEGFLQAAKMLRVDKILSNNRDLRKSIKKSDSYLKESSAMAKPMALLEMEKKEEPTPKPVKGKPKGKGRKPAKPKQVKAPEGLAAVIQPQNEVTKSQHRKPSPTENCKRSGPLGSSTKGNMQGLPNRVASILEASRPRAPSPHPKIDNRNKARVFYVTPLIKKVQCTTPSEENKSGNESLGQNRGEFTFRVSRGGSSRFASIAMTQSQNKMATPTASNIRATRSTTGLRVDADDKSGEVLSKSKSRRSSTLPSRVNKLTAVENTGKHKNKTTHSYEYVRPHGKENGCNSHEKKGARSKNCKPNPRVSESVCAPHAPRTRRKSFFRQQLEQDVSAI